MKYEIIKGSEKDFEGAPDEALFVLQCFSTIDYSVDMKATIDGQSLTPDCSQYIIAERRPITEPVWDGEGLPPVGVECELKSEEYADFDWVKVRIVFEHNGELIAIVNMPDEPIHDRMSKHSAGYDAAKFRPIRSPEDVARDEAIDDMAGIIEYRRGCSPKSLAGWLYDAGYRKME